MKKKKPLKKPKKVPKPASIKNSPNKKVPSKNVSSFPLVNNTQPLIAVLLRKGTWPMYGFFKEVLQGIQRVAFSRGYGLVTIDPPPGKDMDFTLLNQSLKKVVSGLLLVAPQMEQKELNEMKHNHFPTVLLFRKDPHFNFVEVDNEGGALSVVNHLYQLGHRKIAFLNGLKGSPGSKARYQGYMKGLSNLGISVPNGYILDADFDQAKAYQAMKTLLQLKDPPSAVFAANDNMALGAISAAQDQGLSVPGHIAVVGFDDVEMPSLTFRVPPLTTVRQPVYDIAKEGAENLIFHIEGRVKDLRQKIFPSQLVIRSSCGASLQRSK